MHQNVEPKHDSPELDEATLGVLQQLLSIGEGALQRCFAALEERDYDALLIAIDHFGSIDMAIKNLLKRAPYRTRRDRMKQTLPSGSDPNG